MKQMVYLNHTRGTCKWRKIQMTKINIIGPPIPPSAGFSCYLQRAVIWPNCRGVYKLPHRILPARSLPNQTLMRRLVLNNSQYEFASCFNGIVVAFTLCTRREYFSLGTCIVMKSVGPISQSCLSTKKQLNLCLPEYGYQPNYQGPTSKSCL